MRGMDSRGREGCLLAAVAAAALAVYHLLRWLIKGG